MCNAGGFARSDEGGHSITTWCMHGRSRQGAGVLIEVDRVRSRHRALEELRTGLLLSGLQGVCPAPRSVGADGVFLSFNAVRKFNLRSRRGGRRARRRWTVLFTVRCNVTSTAITSWMERAEGRGQGFYVGRSDRQPRVRARASRCRSCACVALVRPCVRAVASVPR